MESQQGMGIFDAAMTTPGADDAEHMANSPVMHVALSARLGLDPSEMAMYRSDMFPSGETPAMRERPAKAPCQRTRLSLCLLPSDVMRCLTSDENTNLRMHGNAHGKDLVTVAQGTIMGCVWLRGSFEFASVAALAAHSLTFEHVTGSRAAAGTGRRKRAQSRSPVTGAAEAFESQAPRAGPPQPREPVQAEAQAAPAAQPAVTSWREGPAVLQPPSGRAEGKNDDSCIPNSSCPLLHRGGSSSGDDGCNCDQAISLLCQLTIPSTACDM